MAGQVISSKNLVESLKNQARQHVEYFMEKTGAKPSLTIITSGDNQASKSYVKNKILLAKECLIDSDVIYLDENKMHEYDQLTTNLNNSRDISGFMLQLPPPIFLETHNQTLDIKQEMFNINKEKDVDCLQGNSYHSWARGDKKSYAPCTPLGIMRYIKFLNIDLKGKHVALIGRSRLVSKPLFKMLIKEDATVTMCHSKTKDLQKAISNADIVIPVVGKAGLLKADNIQEGQILIDVGINNVDGKLVGDCDSSCLEKASIVTPVPGGVGPLTVMSLITNTIDAAYLQNGMAKPEWNT